MSKQRMLPAVLLAVVFGGLMWLGLASGPREPVYDGKPISYWLKGYTSGRFNPAHPGGPSVPTYSEADDAIRHMGTNAIPTLIQMLREKESPLKHTLVSLAKKQHFFRLTYMSPADKTLAAMRAFDAIGPQATEVAPQLVEIYDLDPSGFSRQVVPEILSHVAPSAPETVPLLLRALAETNDAMVRANAAGALAKIRPKPEMVVPALTKALSDPDPWVQASAAQALGGFGAEAKSAVPVLTQRLQSELAKNPGLASVGTISVSQNGWVFNSHTSLGFVFAPGASRSWVVIPLPPQTVVNVMEEALKAIDLDAAQAALK
jgi:hypothetical protein